MHFNGKKKFQDRKFLVIFAHAKGGEERKMYGRTCLFSDAICLKAHTENPHKQYRTIQILIEFIFFFFEKREYFQKFMISLCC